MTFNDLFNDLQNLTKLDNLTFSIIGYSTMGLPIYCFHIGNFTGKQILMEGGIHAREYLSTLFLIKETEYLTTQTIEDGGIYIIPCVNPDGIRLVLSGFEGLTCQKQKDILKQIMISEIDYEIPEYEYPLVILVAGVNGVGKTTAIGKLAKYFRSEGKSVVLAAADTFRAAASDQLTVWAERAGVRIVKQSEGSDPAAVVFDAINSAKARKDDVVLIDTAGRLHNKKNLMNELNKIHKVVDREYPDCDYRSYIVLDATTGQNAVAQVETFGEIFDIDGIILNKLDGTAKGGVVFAISSEQEIPVCFVGVGEKIDDLIKFDATSFVEELID